MSYTNDQLSTMIDALTARVAVMDGQGLADPSLGTVPKNAADIAGVRQDLTQAVLKLEQILNTFKTSLTSWTNLLRSHLGLPPQS